MALTFDTTIAQLAAINRGVIKQDPEAFAKLLQVFVDDGSQTHVLAIDDLTVFATPADMAATTDGALYDNIGDLKVANTVTGLMNAGARFFDAVLYLSLDKTLRPRVNVHPTPKKADSTHKFPLYNDISQITRFLFVVYFFIMIRGHAPNNSADHKGQPMPKFISSVLGITESASAIAEYLASFPLININPTWVRHIQVKGISQEASSRFGLGVAGYRIVSIFNSRDQDRYRTTKASEPIKADEVDREPLENMPDWLEGAISTARSFLAAGVCWNFHPATRSPNVLSVYGNINKNATNLVLAAYQEKTIEKLLSSKKLSVKPVEDIGHNEYKTWGNAVHYSATAKIFN